MKAIYDNKVYNVVDASGALTLATATGTQFAVDYGDEHLIVDPTDDEIADAENLAEHYNTDEDGALVLRRVLRGELQIGRWWDWKADRERRQI